MKHSHTSKGFTLVELLVVISIIAVLASAGFAAANAAIQKARKTTALATATALESAVTRYYDDYGSMPKEGTDDVVVQTDTDVSLLNVLLGNDTTLNQRGIRFLSVKEGKSKKNGLIYSGGGNTIEGLYDPWGGPYFVMLDLGMDEKITPDPAAPGANMTLNGRRVAVWSNGADYAQNPPGKANDDVKTWGQ